MSANNDYKVYKHLSSGDNLRSVARASRINALQNLTRSHSDGAPYSRSGVPRSIGPGWVVNRKPRKIWAAGGAIAQRTPFKVIYRVNNETLQMGVIQDSHVFNTESQSIYEYDNTQWGLLDVDEEYGWIDIGYDQGKKFYLEIELVEQTLEVASIELIYNYVGTQESWTTFPDPIEIDIEEGEPPAQLYWHQIIAEITDPNSDPRDGTILTLPNSNGIQIQLTQCLFENIILTPARTTHDANEQYQAILVNSGQYAPATETGGSGTAIPPESNLMTPWTFGRETNNFDFELVDASVGTEAQVLVYDGVIYTLNNEPADPDGMPSDNNYIIGDLNDGDEIWVGFTYENDKNYEVTSCWIDHGAQTPDDAPEDLTAYVTLGHVDVLTNPQTGNKIVNTFNEICGDIFWNPPRFDVHFDFQIEDASEGSTAMVRIWDGVVYTANNDGADPAGMPSEDGNSYIIGVEDTYEIWVGFTYENHLNYEVTSCWIATGPQTPDDDPPNNTAYVTLGHVDVNYSGDENVAQVYPVNEICGDIFWEPPRFDVHFNFQLEDASDGWIPQVRVYDGLILYPNGDDPYDGFFYPAGMPSNNSYVIGVEDGWEIWVGIQWNFEMDDGVSGEDIESAWIQAGDHTPEDAGLITYVTLGHVDVNYQDDGTVQVYPFNEVLGDIRIPYPPNLDSPELLSLCVDKDTGHVVWKTSKIAQVTGEYTGFEGDSGEAWLDDIDVLTFDVADFSVWDGGGGQAVVTLNEDNILSVQGDSGYVDFVNHIQFTIASDPSAGYINVYESGDGVAIVEIPVLPTTGSGTEVLGSDGGDIQWFTTDQCEN